MFKKSLLSSAVAVASASTGIYVDPSTMTIRDGFDRQTVFHGVNVVYKQKPYIPTTDKFDAENSLSDKDIKYLKSWGMNFIRLGVMWEAVETSPGVYDEAYLKKVNDLITHLGENGIYTLLDAHQDVAARIACGEGVPDFYAKDIEKDSDYCFSKVLDPLLKKIGACKSMDSYGYKKDKNGDPILADCAKKTFTDYYATSEVMSVFRAIYDNKIHMQEKYVDYWAEVADKLSQNPYVVGFDPINEPGPGFDSITDMFQSLMPGQFDVRKLEPLYKKIYARLHAANKSNVMWFEPCQFPDGVSPGIPGYPGVFNVGFKTPPGGNIGSATHILNDHAYCCQAGPDVCAATGEPQTKDKARCGAWHEKKIGKRAQNAKRLGVPLFFSEFGSCTNSAPCVTELNQVLDESEKYLTTGWAYWQYKNYMDLTSTSGDRPEGFFNSDGTVQNLKVKALSRTYLKHAQGTIVSTRFAHEDQDQLKAGQFMAEVEVDASIEAPSVLHAFQWGSEGMNGEDTWYPNGYDVIFGASNDEKVPAVETLKTEDGTNDFNFRVQQQNFDGKVLRICVTPKDVPMDCGSIRSHQQEMKEETVSAVETYTDQFIEYIQN